MSDDSLRLDEWATLVIANLAEAIYALPIGAQRRIAVRRMVADTLAADWGNALIDARTFLQSIASAQSQGSQEQTDWMIAQAREGLERSRPK